MKHLAPLLLLAAAAVTALAEPVFVRPVPPPGIAITSADRAELSAGVAALGNEIAALEKDLSGKPELLALLPDVQIFHKAVDWALRYDEFFLPSQAGIAKQQLEMGKARAAELRAGKPSWNALSGADDQPTADGKDKLPALLVRGYRSKIDGSVQPYGLVLPEDFKPSENRPRPLHFWCHGRGEKLSELDFIQGRLTNPGEYTPPGAFVIHLYGRYCCANKFAGEVDLFEALADAKKHYPIDDARLVVRGFSMGGASTWQFATHFAGMWAAANPGAGFGESKEFLKLGTAPDKPMPPEWEQKLWRWYDSTLYVSNLANTTTVAYSGEIDGQKQAADIMIRFARQEAGNAQPPVAELGKVAPGDGSPKAGDARVQGTAPDLALYHVIAPQTPHKILAGAKPEVENLVETAVEKGNEAAPTKVHFTTYSLVYPRMEWVEIAGMQKQWERAYVTAEVQGDRIIAKTENVSVLRFTTPFGHGTPASDRIKSFIIDGQTIPANWNKAGAEFEREATAWKETGGMGNDGGLKLQTRKVPELCGPIDHAFMSSFVFVRPSGRPLNKLVGDWVESELAHAVTQWRAVFRGDARVLADTAVSADDIAHCNLILWGDPSSNSVLKKMAGKLPLKWDGKQLVFAGQTYAAAHIAPILIFPNPLNPSRYVVLNSSFTFRESALLNNAQQVPKLPDWAIVDLTAPPDAERPGKILRAGFFDEQWQPPAGP